MSLKSAMNKKIEIPHESAIKRLVVVCIAYYWFYYLYDLLDKIPTIAMTLVAQLGLLILQNAPILWIYWKWTENKEPRMDLKNKKQYRNLLLLIPVLAVNYCLFYRLIYGDFSIFSYRTEMPSVGWILFQLMYAFVYVAFVEEFVFRVYIQNELVMIFGRFRFLAPLVGALFFGIVHYVQGSIPMVEINIAVGLILGYAKLYLPNCTYITLVLAHGLYDFIIFML